MHPRLSRSKYGRLIAQHLEKNPDTGTQGRWMAVVVHRCSSSLGSFLTVGAYFALQNQKAHHEMRGFFATTEVLGGHTPFVVAGMAGEIKLTIAAPGLYIPTKWY
jgi:hypothetical protein